jgi:hypothetical protein
MNHIRFTSQLIQLNEIGPGTCFNFQTAACEQRFREFAGCVRTQPAELAQAHPGMQAAVSRLSWPACRKRPYASPALSSP